MTSRMPQEPMVAMAISYEPSRVVSQWRRSLQLVRQPCPLAFHIEPREPLYRW